MPFERRPGAEGNDRHAVVGAGAHDILHVLGGLGEDDAIGRLAGNIGRGVGMLLADRAAGLQSLAEPLFQNAEHGGDAVFVARHRRQVAQGHVFFRVWAIGWLREAVGLFKIGMKQFRRA